MYTVIFGKFLFERKNICCDIKTTYVGAILKRIEKTSVKRIKPVLKLVNFR